MRARLTTPRLRLTAVGPADAEELHELFADPLTHTVGSGPFTSMSQTRRWIRNRIAAQQDHGLCWYALRERETDALIGNCGLLKGRMTWAEPEIGYEIRADRRGHGFAIEAAAAVLDECRTAGLERLWATIRPDNAASLRIVARLGMRAERTDQDDRGPLLFYVVDVPERTVGRGDR